VFYSLILYSVKCLAFVFNQISNKEGLVDIGEINPLKKYLEGK
jgi:hypothetical protein